MEHAVPGSSRSWIDLDRATRRAPARLSRELVPIEPGVYAWYREGAAVYVGKAASLRERVWGNHLGQSAGLTGSAFRRNVAESLGFGSATSIKKRQVALTDEQRAAVRGWILGCEVAWLVCATPAEALALETALKAERKPRLTKR